MTETATPVAVQTEGAGTPPPPPLPAKESRGADYAAHAGFAKMLYDYTIVFGPMDQATLRSESYDSIPSQAWREFVRFHPDTPNKNDPGKRLREAKNFYFDMALLHGLERGWLQQRADHKIVTGTVPPEHEVLSTTGKAAGTIAARLTRGDNHKAMAILNGELRAKPTTEGRAALKKSLVLYGQITPIIRWRPFGRPADDPIIVDGKTRLDILHGLGYVDSRDQATNGESIIQWVDVPRETDAVTVLGMRIATEFVKDSKDTATRNTYIAELAQQGMTQEDIAKIVKLSQQHVSRILSTVHAMSTVDRPSDQDVAEFQRLAGAGWDQRAIAEETGWSHGTVNNYLTVKRTPPPSTSNGQADSVSAENPSKPSKPPKPSKTRTAETKRVAEKHGVTENTIAHAGSKKIVASLDARPDVRQEVYKDEDLTLALLEEALAMPHYAEAALQFLGVPFIAEWMETQGIRCSVIDTDAVETV